MGFTPRGTSPVMVSPATLICTEVPVAAVPPDEAPPVKTTTAVPDAFGSGAGFGNGFAIGRKVSPHPAMKNNDDNPSSAVKAPCFNFIPSPEPVGLILNSSSLDGGRQPNALHQASSCVPLSSHIGTPQI